MIRVCVRLARRRGDRWDGIDFDRSFRVGRSDIGAVSRAWMMGVFLFARARSIRVADGGFRVSRVRAV